MTTKMPLDHSGQFKSGDKVYVTRYGEREDWAYPHCLAAKLTSLSVVDGTKRIRPVPPMPEVIEVIFEEFDLKTGIAMVSDRERGILWNVPVGYVKTKEWVGEWMPLDDKLKK